MAPVRRTRPAPVVPIEPAPQSVHWPASSIEMRTVASIVPFERNARTHSEEQVAQIAASIEEWGWTIPLLVDEASVVIAGHGRLLAAQKLGITEVPVMVARGWTSTQKRAYTIADNQIALNSGWDDLMLAEELSTLQHDDGFSMDLLGFDEVESLMSMTTEDETASTPGETVPVSGHNRTIGGAPGEFPSYGEDIATDHCCPRCQYKWSGKTS